MSNETIPAATEAERDPTALSADTDSDAAPSDLDEDLEYAMSNSFAFGGLNAALVFGPPPA